MDMIIYNGKRCSVVVVYFYLIKFRLNLFTKINILVRRILFEGKRVVGIEYFKDFGVQKVYGEEIILSGGVVNFLQFLMLLGVGNVDEFCQLDILVVQYLFGVGENFQDYVEVFV